MSIFTLSIKAPPVAGSVVPQILPIVLKSIPDRLRDLYWYILDPEVILSDGNLLKRFCAGCDQSLDWDCFVDKISRVEQALDLTILGCSLKLSDKEAESLFLSGKIYEKFLAVSLVDSGEWILSSDGLEFIREISLRLSDS